MKKVINTLSVILILVISYATTVFSQVYIAGADGEQSTMGLLALMDKTNVKWKLEDRQNIKGSPYLNDEFEKGEVVLTDNTTFKDVFLRYNIYNDQMEFQQEGENYAIGSKILLRNISIGDQIFVVSIYYSGLGEEQGFFTLLADGKARLLSKYDMKLTDPVPSKPMQDPQPSKFVRKQDIYFIQIGKERLYQISSVNKLIAHLGDPEGELKKFAKTEKISSGDPEELAQLIKYYNSL